MGYYSDALTRLESRFGDMVASSYSTLWEGWEYTGGRGMTYKSGNGTYNHAWSGGGLTILSQYIAGISPIEPAFKSFRVSPNLAKLKFVESVVPTIYGNIEMHAEKVYPQLVISLTVPQGTTAQVVVPHGYNNLECNGVNASELTLTAGKYRIIAE